VGENWLPRLQDMGAASPGGQASEVDMATLKLFEFLTASMCLYVVDEQQLASGSEPHEVFQYTAPRGAKRWTHRAWAWVMAGACCLVGPAGSCRCGRCAAQDRARTLYGNFCQRRN
jgi:hypothetical protein